MAKLKENRYPSTNGHLVISLDFELYWGVHDVYNKEDYVEVIKNARKTIPRLLRLFTEHKIRSTWAVVGMLNAYNVKELYELLPETNPNYVNKKLSTYKHMKQIGSTKQEAELYFAPELIQLIQNTNGQEIGSHTFSHYYCLEKGQTKKDFITDSSLFEKIMKPVTEEIQSIVFPRNQVNQDHLSVCQQRGIKAYRGNESGWIYQMKGNDRKHLLKRGLRLLDMYVNLFGHQTYLIKQKEFPLNIRGSRQLKTASAKWGWLEKRRLNRILTSMTYAAKHKQIYHLWWHPHNFGIQTENNLYFLKKS